MEDMDVDLFFSPMACSLASRITAYEDTERVQGYRRGMGTLREAEVARHQAA
jgi:hypothetical protein